MALATNIAQLIRTAVETALRAIDGNAAEWRTDLRQALRDHFRQPKDITPQESPWVFVAPGDMELEPGVSQLEKGTNDTLIYVVVRTDPIRTGRTAPREAIENLVADIRKKNGQIAKIGDSYEYRRFQADVTVDPEGEFAMALITVTHSVRARVAS